MTDHEGSPLCQTPKSSSDKLVSTRLPRSLLQRRQYLAVDGDVRQVQVHRICDCHASGVRYEYPA